MKKSSRRRLLLSSVVMLLVAVFALGTATYAWFTNTTTAKADNAKVTVAAPSGLVIAAVEAGGTAPAASAYKSTINISSIASKSLTPVSGNVIDTGVTFYEAKVDADKKVTGITAADAANYIAIDIYAKLSASNKVDGVETAKSVNLTSIASTGNTQGQVVRCAYYGYASETASKLAYVNFGTAARSVNPVKATAAASAGIITDDNFVIPSTFTEYVNSALEASVNFATATATGSAKYGTATKIATIYLWVEGQDELCNNANVETITGATNDIAFNFELAN